jgi:hypothetical protein
MTEQLMSKRKADGQSQSNYEVGYRRPPRQNRFRKGHSGNPSGKKAETRPLAADLRALFEQALNKKLAHNERQEYTTAAAAGFEQLVTQFAAGDRHARRDLFFLAEKLGVDLTLDQNGAKVVRAALAAEDEAIITDFLRRHGVEPQQGAATTPDPSPDQNNGDCGTSEEDS